MEHTLNIKLEDVIQDMLYRYECVVIPGFGGFVSHYQPAQILADKNLILPPSKALTFNVLLKRNDGLLAQELVIKHQITYHEALHFIEVQVDEWLSLLSSSKKVTIPGVGNVGKNKKGSVIFSQDSKTNLLNDAYGLSVIKAQVLKKDGISGKIKEEFVQRQTSPSFNSNIRKITTGGSIAAVMLVMLIWSYLNFDLVQQRAESLSVFMTSEKEELIETGSNDDKSIEKSEKFDNILIPTDSELLKDSVFEVNELLIKYLNKEIDSLFSDVHEEPEVAKSTEKQEAKIDNTEVHEDQKEASNEELDEGNYIIVAGCFRSLHNANKFVNELKTLGYEAHLSGYSTTGLHRVAYGSYNNRSNALKSMRWIQSTHNAQAWMTTR